MQYQPPASSGKRKRMRGTDLRTDRDAVPWRRSRHTRRDERREQSTGGWCGCCGGRRGRARRMQVAHWTASRKVPSSLLKVWKNGPRPRRHAHTAAVSRVMQSSRGARARRIRHEGANALAVASHRSRVEWKDAILHPGLSHGYCEGKGEGVAFGAARGINRHGAHQRKTA